MLYYIQKGDEIMDKFDNIIDSIDNFFMNVIGCIMGIVGIIINVLVWLTVIGAPMAGIIILILIGFGFFR